MARVSARSRLPRASAERRAGSSASAGLSTALAARRGQPPAAAAVDLEPESQLEYGCFMPVGGRGPRSPVVYSLSPGLHTGSEIVDSEVPGFV